MTITGNGFAGPDGQLGTADDAASVWFVGGGSQSAGTRFIVVSDNEISVVTPPEGTIFYSANVVVAFPNGAYSPSPVNFQFTTDPRMLVSCQSPSGFVAPASATSTVASVAPCKGATAGGTTVVVTGTGFYGPDGLVGGGDDATDVNFASIMVDGIPGTNFHIDSDTQITVTTPARVAGLDVVDVIFADHSDQYLPASFLYSDDSNAHGPCEFTPLPSAVPAMQHELVPVHGCMAVEDQVRVWGNHLDQFSATDPSAGLWVQVGGFPGGSAPFTAGAGEIKAVLVSQTATELVFRLPAAIELSGWTPGDYVETVFRNGFGQVWSSGDNWWQPGSCHYVPPSPQSPALAGGWQPCSPTVTSSCYDITDTSGVPIPGLALWSYARRRDLTNWTLAFRVVPSNAPDQAPTGRTIISTTINDLWQPPDPTGTAYDLSPYVTEASTIRITFRTGRLLMANVGLLRAAVDPVAGLDLSTSATADTLVMDLHPVSVTFPSAADRPVCELHYVPTSPTGFDPPVCAAIQGDQTQLVLAGFLQRDPFRGSPASGTWTATNATLADNWVIVRSPEGAPTMKVSLAAPHLTAAGTLNQGQLQGFIPDRMLTALGIAAANASDLAAQLRISSTDGSMVLSSQFTRQTGGYLFTVAGLHYSAPTVLARTAPATATSVSPTIGNSGTVVIRGAGFLNPDGSPRVREALLQWSPYERRAMQFTVVNDTTVQATLPSTGADADVTVHLVGAFGDVGGLAFHYGAPQHLAVTLSGLGSGSVSAPVGISCGTTCDVDLAVGTSVVLTATPGDYSAFAGWSGGGCTGTAPTCTVLVTAATAVTASFALLPAPGQVSAGDRQSCAIVKGGLVWCWGDGANGGLGNGATSSSSMPVAVASLKDVSAIDVGSGFSCAAVDAGPMGTAKCWGLNTSGQLGDGSTVNSAVPVTVKTGASVRLTGVTGVSAGVDHACAVLLGGVKGTVRCWGSNSHGQLGDGRSVASTRPVVVVSAPGVPLVGVVSVSVGNQSTCAVMTTGAVRCWGMGTSGQIGDGGKADSYRPKTVTGIDGSVAAAVSVSVGDQFACARMTNGSVRCWGLNTSGQLGDGTTTSARTPVLVRTVGGVLLGVASSVQVGNGHACARVGSSSSAQLRCWGANANGQLGDGTTVNRTYATTVALSGVTGVACGGNHSLALVANGLRPPAAVWAWGLNTSGQLGDGTMLTSLQPVPVRRL